MRQSECDFYFPNPLAGFTEEEGVDVEGSLYNWQRIVEDFVLNEGPNDLIFNVRWNYPGSLFLNAYDFEEDCYNEKADEFCNLVEEHIEYLHDNMEEWVVTYESDDDELD